MTSLTKKGHAKVPILSKAIKCTPYKIHNITT